MPRLGTLLGMELKGRFNLEDQKGNGRFGAGRPDWELCWGCNSKAYLICKIKKKMVELGQGAQGGNFAGDGTEKQIELGRSKRKW